MSYNSHRYVPGYLKLRDTDKTPALTFDTALIYADWTARTKKGKQRSQAGDASGLSRFPCLRSKQDEPSVPQN